jgi:hypothetical protein
MAFVVAAIAGTTGATIGATAGTSAGSGPIATVRPRQVEPAEGVEPLGRFCSTEDRSALLDHEYVSAKARRTT